MPAAMNETVYAEHGVSSRQLVIHVMSFGFFVTCVRVLNSKLFAEQYHISPPCYKVVLSRDGLNLSELS